MADDRLFLLHRPSLRGVLLAKRYGMHWYDETEDRHGAMEQLLMLSTGEPGDLELWFESTGRDLAYGMTDEDGLRRFEVVKKPEEV